MRNESRDNLKKEKKKEVEGRWAVTGCGEQERKERNLNKRKAKAANLPSSTMGTTKCAERGCTYCQGTV